MVTYIGKKCLKTPFNVKFVHLNFAANYATFGVRFVASLIFMLNTIYLNS